jgi:hypothetical protein
MLNRFSSAFFSLYPEIPLTDRYGIYCTAERLARIRSVSVQDIFSGAYMNPKAAEKLISLAKAIGESR